ncbi:transmembrane protein [Rhynchospora pubera]|uniref:Transmembrane protein n=1 Tax=Rhynchospora pubera TaxID=906938 RepID=A0AAV8CEA7_9POAL|nr:transmembrane protein [Rhynchospora pubera]
MAERAVGGPAPPPHGAILAVVVGAVVAAPFIIGDSAGEAITEAMAELLSPVGLLLLPVTLIIIIRFLSSDRGIALSDVFNFSGSPDSFHRVGGSPVGVALILLIIMLLLYFKLFGGGDDDDD